MAQVAMPVLLTVGCGEAQVWADLDPDWLDIPHDSEAPRLGRTKLLRSFHNYEGMRCPRVRLPADLHKFALTPKSSLEALELMQMEGLVVGMGADGTPTRQLSHLMGNPWTYAHFGTPTAPGQLSIDQLHPGSELLGLLGDPVAMSPSQLTHNAVCRELELDAVYVKWRVTKEELPAFLERSRWLPWRGFSVTMPLKEAIVPFLDNADAPVVNTVVVRDGQLHGMNTDGLGALDALEERMPVLGKRVLILGAGGTAQAIEAEARRRGAIVQMASRRWGLDAVQQMEYDHLIHATPVGFGDPEAIVIPPDWIRPGTVVLDAVHHPPMTRLLREALARGCEVISGVELFINQAARQFEIWYGDAVNREHVREILWQHISLKVDIPSRA